MLIHSKSYTILYTHTQPHDATQRKTKFFLLHLDPVEFID